MTKTQLARKTGSGGARPKPRFAMCPGCSRERRYTKDGLMVSHRKWMTGFPGHAYGYMMFCRGSYRPFVPGTEVNP